MVRADGPVRMTDRDSYAQAPSAADGELCVHGGVPPRCGRGSCAFRPGMDSPCARWNATAVDPWAVIRPVFHFRGFRSNHDPRAGNASWIMDEPMTPGSKHAPGRMQSASFA
jgi:hypothetical protein